MAMRGILVAVACAVVMGGCYESFPRIYHECGNGIVEPPEECDDGNLIDTDACLTDCRNARCGDGFAWAGSEECDDGNDNDCDGCKANCEWARALHVNGGDLGASVAEESIPCLPCPFTIEAWYTMDDDAGYWNLYDIPSYAFSTIGAHGFHISGPLGGVRSSDSWGIAPGTWHHFAVSCWEEGGDEWTRAHYFDGEWVGGGSSGWHDLSCTGPMSIADALSSLSGGSIDDLRFSNQALYTNTGSHSHFTPRRYLSVRDDTVAFWDFDQEVEGVIPDASGNGHDAVLEDGTFVPDDCHQP
jgi:cysteine-rich repeat protein